MKKLAIQKLSLGEAEVDFRWAGTETFEVEGMLAI